MRTEIFPGGIAPSDHELAINRLESFGRDLRSPKPPRRFNPLNFKGIEALRAAASNLEVQHGIGRSIRVVQERLEASLRFVALQSIEHDPEPKTFDRFSAGDLAHLFFFYGAFHQDITRVLDSNVISIQDVKALAEKHEEKNESKIPPSRALLTQKREAVIDKLQDWLVDPKIDQIMEDLLPADNEGDDLWLFMDSIKTLDGQLGLKHKMNIKDFFRRNLEALGSHTYHVDFSKKGNGVVETSSNRPVAEVQDPSDVREIDTPEQRPFPETGTVIFQQASLEPTHPIIQVDVEAGQTQSVSEVLDPSSESILSRLKAVEQRDPNIRERLKECLEDVLGRPEFVAAVRGEGLNRVYNRLKTSVISRILENKLVKVPFDKDGHPRFDSVAVATILYLTAHGSNLPSRLRRQVQDIAAEEYRKRQEEAK